GEWVNPGTTAPLGSQFPSGNGTAAGDFVFDFVIGGVTGTAVLDPDARVGSPTGAALPGTIEGSIWYHRASSPDLGQTADEPGIDGQIVVLTTAAGTVVATATTAPLDLDGDGIIEATERGGFRFAGVAAGSYRVQQMPVFPWLQATPGGVSAAETLYAVSHETASAKNTLWTIDTATLVATKVRDFQTFTARDVAFTDRTTAWFSGTASAAGGATPAGSGGLWRMDLASGALTDLGMIPGGQPLLSLDVLDAATLLGVTVDGEVLRYSLPTGIWEARGPMLTAGNQRLYPVGDTAVFSPREVYVVCLTQKNPAMTGSLAAFQVLVRLDPTMLGANATIVQELQASELLIGLEQTATGGLVALGTGKGLYSFATPAGALTRAGTVSASAAFNFGGLASAPAGIITDTSRRDFLVTVGSGQTVTVGFGDVPDWQVLEDGDDLIDGGCGTDADILHGDDGSDLPWYVKTIGGHDDMRGRAGDDQIFGGQQGDMIRGEEGNDTIVGGDSASNRIDGGDGIDTITGGDADDVISGGAGADTIHGGKGDDTIFGDAGNDTLFGDSGDDALVGGAGQDSVSGDDGNDTIYVIDAVLGGGFGVIPGTTADTYAGGAGSDTIVIRADIATTLTNAAVTVYGTAHVVASVETALLTGGASGNTINAAGFGGTTTIRGLEGADTLTGGSSTDTIFGGAGNDTISGGAGSDTIAGGTGSNSLAGGADSDTYDFTDAFDDVVVEGAGGGAADVLDLSALAGSLTAVVDSPANGTRIFGWGPLLAVQYYGNEVERIRLGTGDDIVYLKDGVSTVARIESGAGEDTLSYGGYGSSPWASGVTVNLLTGAATGITGGISGFEDITGGDGGDTLTGDNGANVFFGGAGADTIVGNGGADLLYGEDGNDSLHGGGGDDMLSAGGGTNTLTGGLGDDSYVFYAAGAIDTVVEAAGQGTDLLDFAYLSAVGITATISGTIAVTYGTSTVSVATAAGIDRVRGSSQVDRFIVADGTAFGGILDGGGIPGYGFADLDILDFAAWTAPVTVSYLGALDASFVGSATGTGGVVNLR
ncbi:MAG: calcium-binding protein, partial [Pirellulales bacterium]